jgi:hypothetical protein
MTDNSQALPLMNIVFGKLVGDFNNYFVPGAAPSEETFKASISQSRWEFHGHEVVVIFEPNDFLLVSI